MKIDATISDLPTLMRLRTRLFYCMSKSSSVALAALTFFVVLGEANANWERILEIQLHRQAGYIQQGLDDPEVRRVYEYLESIDDDPALINVSPEEISDEPFIQAQHRALRLFAGVEELESVEEQDVRHPMIGFWPVYEVSGEKYEHVTEAIQEDWLRKFLNSNPKALMLEKPVLLVMASSAVNPVFSNRPSDMVDMICAIQAAEFDSSSFQDKFRERHLAHFSEPRPGMDPLDHYFDQLTAESVLAFLMNDADCKYVSYFMNLLYWWVKQGHELGGTVETSMTRALELIEAEVGEYDAREVDALACALVGEGDIRSGEGGMDAEFGERLEVLERLIGRYLRSNRRCLHPDLIEHVDFRKDPE